MAGELGRRYSRWWKMEGENGEAEEEGGNGLATLFSPSSQFSLLPHGLIPF